MRTKPTFDSSVCQEELIPIARIVGVYGLGPVILDSNYRMLRESSESAMSLDETFAALFGRDSTILTNGAINDARDQAQP